MHDGLVLLRRAAVAAADRESGQVSAHLHQREVVVARLDERAYRIGTERLGPAAVAAHAVRRHERPRAREPLIEGFLLDYCVVGE